MKNKTVRLALISLSLTCSLDAYTADYHLNGFLLSASVGALSGEAHEYVYLPQTDYKLSQLDWRIKNAAIINGEVNYDVLSWLSANGRGWVTVGENKAAMDDYDWLDPNQRTWTDWSHHNNTNLNDANELDLSLSAWLMQKQNYKLGVTAGYQTNSFSWKARGGCYQYNNRTIEGCLPSNMLGIGYRQRFSAPYIGLSGKYLINNFEINPRLKFSNSVSARDQDEHYLRNITFNEASDNSRYYAAIIDAGYHVTPHTKVFVEAAYNHYTNGRADTAMTDNDTGEYVYLRNSAGLSNKNYTVALGLQYLF